MGPFEMGDLSRLRYDVFEHLEYLHKTLGEKYRPSPLLVKYVKAGRLGKKSGQGVYQLQRSVNRCRTLDNIQLKRTTIRPILL